METTVEHAITDKCDDLPPIEESENDAEALMLEGDPSINLSSEGRAGDDISSPPPENMSYGRFLITLSRSPAGHLLSITSLFSLGIGCTVGLIPQFMTQRYADHCSLDDSVCIDAASRQAQQAAAVSTLVMNLLTLICNSVVGSWSDRHGRRPVLLASLALSTLSPAVLVYIQYDQYLSPAWFYASNSVVGMVNFVSTCFTILTDCVAEDLRSAAFGVFLGIFFFSFSLAPSLALVLNHVQICLLSFVLVLLAFVYAVLALPETLTTTDTSIVGPNNDQESSPSPLCSALTRPLVELSILGRNRALRLLTLASLLSGMVYSTDATLVLYYMEQSFHIQDVDLAKMFVVMGVVGMVVQAGLLKGLVALLGQEGLLVVSFVSGTIHNLLYGVARTKAVFYVALSLSQLTKTNFPLLSALAAMHVSPDQQGRLQGAMFSMSALANAMGPIVLELLTRRHHDGSMFVAAGGLYLMGTVVVACLPRHAGETEDKDDLGEPLLS